MLINPLPTNGTLCHGLSIGPIGNLCGYLILSVIPVLFFMVSVSLSRFLWFVKG